MSEIWDIISRRATCRNFLTDPIPDDVLERIYRGACSSASSAGFQRVSIIAVKDEEKKMALRKMSRNQGFISRAPVNLVFCADLRRTARLAKLEYAPYKDCDDMGALWMGIVDATIAAQTAAIVAEGMGLASCYNGNIIEHMDELCELLKIPQNVTPVIMLTMGYPRRKPALSSKYPWEIMVHDEVYRDLQDEALTQEHVKKSGTERYRASEARLDRLKKTAVLLNGEDYAEECVKTAKLSETLTALQYWLGCYYPDDSTAMSQAEFLKTLKKQGFDVAGIFS